MSALIYGKTSIPSFYHETRTETQFQTMREWTREWWDAARLRDELVTSTAVIMELRQAPEPKRSQALALIERAPLLDDVDTVDEIVVVYFQHKLMPRDAEGDARHLALATFHECDFGDMELPPHREREQAGAHSHREFIHWLRHATAHNAV